jgi:hypothetical protein
MMTKIVGLITDLELSELSEVPLAVRVRYLLNRQGFRFKDDMLVSSAINLQPKPLGLFSCKYDYQIRATRYFQEIE